MVGKIKSKSRLNKSRKAKQLKSKTIEDKGCLGKCDRKEMSNRKYKSKYVRKHGFTIGEIAKKLNVSVGTVSSMGHGTIKKLLQGAK